MGAKHWVVDLSEKSLALTETLTELQVGNCVSIQKASHVVDNAQGFVFEQSHG